MTHSGSLSLSLSLCPPTLSHSQYLTLYRCPSPLLFHHYRVLVCPIRSIPFCFSELFILSLFPHSLFVNSLFCPCGMRPFRLPSLHPHPTPSVSLPLFLHLIHSSFFFLLRKACSIFPWFVPRCVSVSDDVLPRLGTIVHSSITMLRIIGILTSNTIFVGGRTRRPFSAI